MRSLLLAISLLSRCDVVRWSDAFVTTTPLPPQCQRGGAAAASSYCSNNRLVETHRRVTKSSSGEIFSDDKDDSSSFARQQSEEPIAPTTRTTSSNHHIINRRQVISHLMPSSLLLLLSTTINPNTADATCITGDDSPDCIGVYKEQIPPIDNLGKASTITQSYGAFRPTAPPIITSTPQSMKEALGMLSDQLIALDEVTQLISSLKNGVAADLETAGVIVLRMLPKLVIAGRYIVSTQTSNDNNTQIMEQMANEINDLGLTLDNHIGKAIRGKLGSTTTMAQLMLLEDVKLLKMSLSNFVERAGGATTL